MPSLMEVTLFFLFYYPYGDELSENIPTRMTMQDMLV